MPARFTAIVFLFLISISYAYAEERVETESEAENKESYFALIDGVAFPLSDFIARLRVGYREKFYHGTPPKEQVAEFEREMIETAINEALLVKEAKRRGMVVAESYVEAEYEKRVKGLTQEEIEASPGFTDKLRQRIENIRLLELIEKSEREAVAEPTEAETLAFYKENPLMFTTPVRDHVQMIMLAVPAYAGEEVWAESQEKAKAIVAELHAGADFSDMAMIHSSDESAASGGDMGFIHEGMLGGAADQMLKLMSVGDTSEPVLLLEGVGIFKLLDRTEPSLNEYSVVEERAVAVLHRQMKDDAWAALKKTLRDNADVVINEALMPEKQP